MVMKEEVKLILSAAAVKAVDTKIEAVVKVEVKLMSVMLVKIFFLFLMLMMMILMILMLMVSVSGMKEVKKGGSKEAFLGFVDKVSSIKLEDVMKVVMEIVKVVMFKESLDLVVKLVSEVVNKV